jgi:FkbM family methyltransferase
MTVDRDADPIEIARCGLPFRVYPKDPPGNPDFWAAEMTWETSTYQALASRLGPGVVFWDVGAWCGPFTLFAKAAGATTWAFEPDPIAYAHLIENLTLDQGRGAGPVFPLMVACGATPGRMALYADLPGNSKTTGRGWGKGQLEVPVLRLDDLAANIQPPAVVKIDCEGMEAEVLEGMMETIVEHRPTLVLSLHPGALVDKDWAMLDRVANIYGEPLNRDDRMPQVWSR